MDDPVSSYISSWPGNSASESYSFLDDPVESYGGEESMQHSNYFSRAASNHHLKYSEHENNSTMFASECLLYSVQTGLLSGEIISKNKLPNNLPQLQQLHNNSDQQSNFMVPGALDYNSTDGSFHPQLDVPHRAELPHALSSSIDSNGSEISAFLADAHAISSASTMCSAFPNVSSYMEPIKLQSFGFQDAQNVAVSRETSAQVANLSQLDNATLTSLNHQNEFLNGGLSCFTTGQQTHLANGGSKTQQQEQNVMRNHHVTTFIAGTQMPFGDAQGAVIPPKIPTWIHDNNDEYPISHSSDAPPQANSANGNGGSVRPRVRARRGQATDPHSIAERLRREKISDRMKNLQDLVPSSKKVDKASMLDEIIEYVKFLQLQVKVLSMSRLGATGAVLPLLAESQTEGPSSQLLSAPTIVQGLLDIPDSEDGYAFEQEVVKLMETSITSAMQYLQNKGLCLMPVALASAISSLKGTAAAATPPDRRNANAGPNLHEEATAKEGTKGCSNAVVSMNCASELKPRA